MMKDQKIIEKKKMNKFDIKLQQRDVDIQRQFLHALKQSNVPFPQQYSQLSQLQSSIQKHGISSLILKSSSQLSQKKSTLKVSNNSQQQQQFQQYQQQPLTPQQLKQRDKQNRKIMGVQTIQDILSEMEDIKNKQYQMEQYEQLRYKQLEVELKEIINNAKEKGKVRHKQKQDKYR